VIGGSGVAAHQRIEGMERLAESLIRVSMPVENRSRIGEIDWRIAAGNGQRQTGEIDRRPDSGLRGAIEKAILGWLVWVMS